jgi:hypothetical protein
MFYHWTTPAKLMFARSFTCYLANHSAETTQAKSQPRRGICAAGKRAYDGNRPWQQC